MSATRRELLLQELERQLESFGKAIDVLSTSFEKCSSFDVRLLQNASQLEALDALTARFARASDILMQKILGLFDALELEERGTIIDRINRGEKRGILSSALVFREIREVRNQIAHEYAEQDLTEIFEKVLRLSPMLIQSLESVKKYSQRFFSN